MSSSISFNRDSLLKLDRAVLISLASSMNCVIHDDWEIGDIVDSILDSRNHEQQTAPPQAQTLQQQDLVIALNIISLRMSQIEQRQFQNITNNLSETDPQAEKLKEIFQKGEFAFRFKKKHLKFEFETLEEIAKLALSNNEENRKQIIDICHKRATTLLVAAKGGWDAVSKYEHAYPKSIKLDSDPEIAKAMDKCISEAKKIKDKYRFHPYQNQPQRGFFRQNNYSGGNGYIGGYNSQPQDNFYNNYQPNYQRKNFNNYGPKQYQPNFNQQFNQSQSFQQFQGQNRPSNL